MTSTAARPVTDFMNDPIGLFGQSYTRMHSIDPAAVVPLRELVRR